eukprot:CAMPEP_0114362604 /NCGR_PEP_ID=MMETSP0101-20121206/25799_1 /TAXON_ID=38822 ORGANISM="Pteridomonas danica, Strain PT" /NCGR_SAMPLE_ID=MMETSP0101 /ASSEMBLY_ACC=CAM_ASM_000211 /LENGTH=380 /DNA_ID=CAMNT_0001508545 /DNA_START=1 /DNA_END=1143 /DNA_ORIENTATION=+
MKNKAQAKALKAYVEKMGIKYKFVDKVHRSTFDQSMDVASDIIVKNEFLNILDLDPTPFALGALNTLDAGPKAEFFEFFCSIHNYCTYNREQLIHHTFNLIDEDGSGRVSIDELALLVHHVYGEVSKCDSGLIVTKNTTDISTAKMVMSNIDKGHSGEVNVNQFAQGIRKHANLINPAFQTQQHIRRAVGGVSMWKLEQERMGQHCRRQGFTVKEVFTEMLKQLKVDSPSNTTGQGGLKKIGTHDLSGNRRTSDRDITDEDDGKSSPGNGSSKKWNTAKSVVKGTNAFNYKLKDQVGDHGGGGGGLQQKKSFTSPPTTKSIDGKLRKTSSGNEKKLGGSGSNPNHLSPIIPNSPNLPAGSGRRSSMKNNNKKVFPSPPSS